MVPKEEFEIVITPDGEIQVRAIGFKGTECVKATKEVGELIAPGTPPLREEKSAEYYEQVEKKGLLKGDIRDE